MDNSRSPFKEISSRISRSQKILKNYKTLFYTFNMKESDKSRNDFKSDSNNRYKIYLF